MLLALKSIRKSAADPLDKAASAHIKTAIYPDMAEEYSIDETHQVIWARCWGVLSDQDILNHQSRLRADPKFRPGFSQLVDATGVTEVTLSSKMMLQMGQSTLFAPEAKRAYVVAQDVMYGLVRMYELYQGLRGQPGVRVFRDRAEAVAWLGVPDQAAPPAPDRPAL